jgi:23S rRNA (uracil1939-C5)-methyltransferase
MQAEVGQTLDLAIDRLGINGEGVGHWQGFTIFVEGALPGEVVRVVLQERRKNFGRGKIVDHLVTSPHRVQPPCPLFGECGGCQLMHLDYPQQLAAKRQRVVDALQRIGKLLDIEVSSCEPAPLPLAYRNKIQLPVAAGGSTIRLGLYARNTHDLVEIEGCHIHCDLGEKTFRSIRQILKDSKISAYNRHTGEGDLRHVLIKTAVHTGQVLVVFVTKDESVLLTPVAEAIMKAALEVKGIVQNINDSTGNSILGRDFRTVAGQGYIEEELHGMVFKVSPASFFQVNPAQAENLYRKALEFAALQGDETVLDAYCGVGTLSLILAKKAGTLIGVECVAEAIEDAQENAKRNAISNVQFYCAQAEEFISTLKGVDVAVLNPPRKGCESVFLESLVVLQPRRIVYISCDPATLARDLQFLCGQGYQIKRVQPFDMFPQTAHVECLVCLTR